MDNNNVINWWNGLSEDEKKTLIDNVKFDLVVVNKIIWATQYEIEVMYNYFMFRKVYELGRSDSRTSEREGYNFDSFNEWFELYSR